MYGFSKPICTVIFHKSISNMHSDFQPLHFYQNGNRRQTGPDRYFSNSWATIYLSVSILVNEVARSACALRIYTSSSQNPTRRRSEPLLLPISATLIGHFVPGRPSPEAIHCMLVLGYRNRGSLRYLAVYRSFVDQIESKGWAQLI